MDRFDKETTTGPVPGTLAGGPNSGSSQRALRKFWLFVAVLALCFVKPLVDWARFALKADLYSHTLLIPAIAGYLVWLRRKEIPVVARGSWGIAAVLGSLGCVGLAGFWGLRAGGAILEVNDYLALTIFSFVCLLAGGTVGIVGIQRVREVALPAVLLLFMIPFPSSLQHWIEVGLQYASAEAVSAIFAVMGTPVLRDGLVFQLPGIRLQVAEECSGIRSSLVLFITSLVAGYLFLRSPWKRTVLAAAVLPLGILRNAFRIYVIAMLCIGVDPAMVDSAIHHRGGPLFFVISLAPLGILLFLLWKSENRGRVAAKGVPK